MAQDTSRQPKAYHNRLGKYSSAQFVRRFGVPGVNRKGPQFARGSQD